ncbi:hypothetical protein J2T58_001659 [Methanocalculus alkaliphilus]|uniref:hypothetical protein n=1 Tax=Methanocalculus alkaliphilus TaxID=768730 RepID=UPI00209E465F|nr:hypothetical protein [Methanocalculus alkaliphilus]MCP1715788.1 hypothetical protein [Methanocalculus alkaliphilus]
MVQGLTILFDDRDNAQRIMRLLKKSGVSAKLSSDPVLTSEEVVVGTIGALKGYLRSLAPDDPVDLEALSLAQGLITSDEEAFTRIMGAIDEDGGRTLLGESSEEPMAEEEIRSRLHDALRLVLYEKQGLITAEDDAIIVTKRIEPDLLEISMPADLILYPEIEELEKAGLTAERMVSSEMHYSVQTGTDIIFCDDPEELISLLEESDPEEESLVAFLEQFFLLLMLADETVRLIGDGAATIGEIHRRLPDTAITADQESYPIRFSIDEEMVTHIVDTLRSKGRISGKDGRLKVR